MDYLSSVDLSRKLDLTSGLKVCLLIFLFSLSHRIICTRRVLRYFYKRREDKEGESKIS